MPRTAVVIGASRGLGLGLVEELLARRWRVIATERSHSAALHQLGEGADAELSVATLDVNELVQIDAFQQRLSSEAIDLLFVNAGVMDDPTARLGDVDDETFASVFKTNVLGPMRLIESLSGKVVEGGVVAAMSSTLASVSSDQPCAFETYAASKAALNQALRAYYRRSGGRRTVLAMVPGWVATEMGGPDAPLDVATSVSGIVTVIEQFFGQAVERFVDYTGARLSW